MGRTSIEVRMLEKIPERYLEDRVYVPDEVAQLDSVYYEPPQDAWHCRIRVQSRYCRMCDLGGYIKQMRPELDMSCWSMREDRLGGVVATVGDVHIQVGAEVLESLKEDHVDSRDFCLCRDSRSLDIGYTNRGWLQRLLPGYLDVKVLKALAATRFKSSQSLSAEDLDGRLQEYEYSSFLPDVMGFLSDCAAYGRKKKLAVYAYLGD